MKAGISMYMEMCIAMCAHMCMDICEDMGLELVGREVYSDGRADGPR